MLEEAPCGVSDLIDAVFERRKSKSETSLVRGTVKHPRKCVEGKDNGKSVNLVVHLNQGCINALDTALVAQCQSYLHDAVSRRVYLFSGGIRVKHNRKEAGFGVLPSRKPLTMADF